jgi:lauroyl/myristoyl acyltransferase
LRYHCALHAGICYRVGLAQWRIEAGPEIATHENGAPRSSEAIMRDVNSAFEQAVKRDSANWFWVHNRWKPINLNRRKLKRAKVELANVDERRARSDAPYQDEI